MAKFIRGPYATVTDVRNALRILKEDGYPDSAITIVANEENDISKISQTTDAEIRSEDVDSLTKHEDAPFWERFTHSFTGFFLREDHGDREKTEVVDDNGDDEAMIASYKKDLEAGKIIILVDDFLNKESRLNIDAARKTDSPKRETNADPSEVMKETTIEDDSHPDIKENESILEEETTYIPPSDDAVSDFSVIRKEHHTPDDIPEDGVLIDKVEGSSYIDGEKGTTGDPNVVDLENDDQNK